MHLSSSSSSSSSDDDPAARAIRRRHRPENELPVSAPLDGEIGRTDDLVLALAGALAFTGGFEFTLMVRSRVARNMFHEITGRPFPDREFDRQLLLGVEFADGRTATNLDEWPPFDRAEGDAITLTGGGGGGGPHAVDHSFFVAPLPPPGRLLVVCAWPAFGLAETRTVLDATPIVAAARRSVVLWPEPTDEPPPVRVPPPELPPGSWFAAATRPPDPPA